MACAAIWGHYVFQAQAAAEGHVWVCSPTTARVWAYICCSCCNWRLCGFLVSDLPPGTILVPMGHAASGLYSYKCYILISGKIWARATAGGQVWVCDPTTTRICGSGCHEDHVNSWGLGCHLGPCCLRTSLLPQPFCPVWPVLPLGNMVTYGPRLLPMTISGFMVLL